MASKQYVRRVLPAAALLAAAIPMAARAQTPTMAAAVAANAPVAAATQTPAAASAPTLFASAADIAALMAKAEADPAKPAVGGGPLVRLDPYHVNLEYRAATGPAAIHETDAELFIVLEGGGTLVTGGRLTGDIQRRESNLSATAIEGGTQRHVAKGDVYLVPENTAHWIKAVDGRLVLISMHVPRPVPSADVIP